MSQALRFNPNSTLPERAVQAWQILVGAARAGNPITYLDLSKLMFGKDAAGVLDRILGHIAFYCKEHGLPQLNVIVVNQQTRKPGNEIPLLPEIFSQRLEKCLKRIGTMSIHQPRKP